MTRNANKISFGELEERERAGREDNIKVGLRQIHCNAGRWMDLVNDRGICSVERSYFTTSFISLPA